MNKITCEICGTVFQDSAGCCPICGWKHNAGPDETVEAGSDWGQDDFDLDALKEEFLSDTRPSGSSTSGKNSAAREQRTVTGGRKVFDFDAVNQESASESDEDDDLTYYSEDGGDEEPHKTNIFLVIILVIFIVLVLLATAFLLFKFLLPGKAEDKAETMPPTVSAEPLETETSETTIPTVPCTSLALPSGVETLKEAGQMWLLHVVVTPEDTTDEVVYYSEDETIVTVNGDGRLTAVGEGSTNVVVTCGDQQIKCPVTVAFEPETEPETTAAATEETEPETEPSNTTLKLKKTDIQFGRLGVYTTLELDCDLDPNEVEWFTSNSAVALVKNGVVTAMGPGIAKITAKYNGQEVTCIVRCKF